MPSEPDLLYLSRADVETLALPLVEVIEAVELGLEEKALGRTIMPPKHWLAPDEHRFFSAMTSAVPAVAAAACKWPSGSDRNAPRGLPYITGLLLLNDLESGLPVAVMDSTWITAQRTAAGAPGGPRPPPGCPGARGPGGAATSSTRWPPAVTSWWWTRTATPGPRSRS
jgi:hypothetical protein